MLEWRGLGGLEVVCGFGWRKWGCDVIRDVLFVIFWEKNCKEFSDMIW